MYNFHFIPFVVYTAILVAGTLGIFALPKQVRLVTAMITAVVAAVWIGGPWNIPLGFFGDHTIECKIGLTILAAMMILIIYIFYKIEHKIPSAHESKNNRGGFRHPTVNKFLHERKSHQQRKGVEKSSKRIPNDRFPW